MYEYKFIEVSIKRGFKVKTGDNFEKCKNIIQQEAKSGWRLKQVITPVDENTGISPYSTSYCYQIVFEKEIK
ncbi:hypothetical protein GCM10008904_28690 [Paraclostridium ghonii]|uniref:DUF4177 domain-containing protein n=1 Tax=Paraclostridium ghonii TaxID=29358 RepID=A0ABU0N3A0_9FIRM|nr:DUF4177 domain-containing protein [Paeniclostridium ghonii]MDQ0557643.1 hypothetical protein [Paeniclostridium ghonii]